MEFEWHNGKNVANQDKHGVSFEEASELFSGDQYLDLPDACHSETELRYISIGPIVRGLVLVVWTERSEDVIRIISARWASKRERAKYIDYMEMETLK